MYFRFLSKRKRVFLAGPIQGMEDRQDYRDALTNFFQALGMEVYDMWKEEKVFYKGFDYETACYLSKKDKQRVRESDFIVAYVPRASIGTTRELEWATQSHKPIFIICPDANPSPHLVSFTEPKRFYRSLDDFFNRWSEKELYKS